MVNLSNSFCIYGNRELALMIVRTIGHYAMGGVIPYARTAVAAAGAAIRDALA